MLLAIYLNDHLAGATGGTELARRSAAANQGSSYGPFLTQLAHEIDEDRHSLLAIMKALGVRRDPLKVGGGWAAEKVARLKPNGQLRGYSPLSRVVELEALGLAVTGKRAGWRTLEGLQLGALARFDLDALGERAEAQFAELEGHRRRATAEAFAAS
jgi:hypothetical protein